MENLKLKYNHVAWFLLAVTVAIFPVVNYMEGEAREREVVVQIGETEAALLRIGAFDEFSCDGLEDVECAERMVSVTDSISRAFSLLNVISSLKAGGAQSSDEISFDKILGRVEAFSESIEDVSKKNALNRVVGVLGELHASGFDADQYVISDEISNYMKRLEAEKEISGKLEGGEMLNMACQSVLENDGLNVTMGCFEIGPNQNVIVVAPAAFISRYGYPSGERQYYKDITYRSVNYDPSGSSQGGEMRKYLLIDKDTVDQFMNETKSDMNSQRDKLISQCRTYVDIVGKYFVGGAR